MEAQSLEPERSWEIIQCKPFTLQVRKQSPRDVSRLALKVQRELGWNQEENQFCEAQGIGGDHTCSPALPLGGKQQQKKTE